MSTSQIISEARVNITNVGTTFVPLISFRRKVGDTANHFIRSYGIDCHTTAHAIVALILNPDSLTNAAFGAFSFIPAAVTTLEADIAASAITIGDGYKIWEGIVDTGSGSNTQYIDFRKFTVQPTGSQIISLVCRAATGTVTMQGAAIRIVEEW